MLADNPLASQIMIPVYQAVKQVVLRSTPLYGYKIDRLDGTYAVINGFTNMGDFGYVSFAITVVNGRRKLNKSSLLEFPK
jgi:hypothetical protein